MYDYYDNNNIEIYYISKILNNNRVKIRFLERKNSITHLWEDPFGDFFEISFFPDCTIVNHGPAMFDINEFIPNISKPKLNFAY